MRFASSVSEVGDKQLDQRHSHSDVAAEQYLTKERPYMVQVFIYIDDYLKRSFDRFCNNEHFNTNSFDAFWLNLASELCVGSVEKLA